MVVVYGAGLSKRGGVAAARAFAAPLGSLPVTHLTDLTAYSMLGPGNKCLSIYSHILYRATTFSGFHKM